MHPSLPRHSLGQEAALSRVSRWTLIGTFIPCKSATRKVSTVASFSDHSRVALYSDITMSEQTQYTHKNKPELVSMFISSSLAGERNVGSLRRNLKTTRDGTQSTVALVALHLNKKWRRARAPCSIKIPRHRAYALQLCASASATPLFTPTRARREKNRENERAPRCGEEFVP